MTQTINSSYVISVLGQFGLHEKEIAFYVALLELGSSTILPVAKKAGIKRTSAYNFIDHLVDLGLVSFYIQNNRHYYKAEHPEQLMRSISRQKEQLDSLIPPIQAILPELISLYEAQAIHPKTELIHGSQKVKQALLESTKSKEKKVFSIIDVDSAVTHIGVAFWEDLIDQLTANGVIAHSLRHQEHKTRIPQYKYSKKQHYQKTLTVPRYLPGRIRIPNTVLCYDSTVIIIAPHHENWALVVESDSFAQTIKMIHSLLWEVSK